jgi:hypothetical protein
MEQILDYIKQNSHTLFKHSENNILEAVFDKKGFFFKPQTQIEYNLIKNSPHLYVAYSTSEDGFYYIGKSFQNGGRWQRSHAYHLGTLAYHLTNNMRYDDQNHQHWIDAWMNIESLNLVENNYSINLKSEVKICFISFSIYSESDCLNDIKKIRELNKFYENKLINYFRDLNFSLLNVQNTKK